MTDFDAASTDMSDGQETDAQARDATTGCQKTKGQEQVNSARGEGTDRPLWLTEPMGKAYRRPRTGSQHWGRSWQPPRLTAGEERRWRRQEGVLLHLLLEGNWRQLHQALTKLPRRHPFDPYSVHLLRELAALLAKHEAPFQDTFEETSERETSTGGAYGEPEESLLEICHEVGWLLWSAPGVDLERTFDLGLELLSPYLRGDRASCVRLLGEHSLACETLVEHLMQGLGELLELDSQVGNRFFGILLYLEIRQRPWPSISEEDFLHLKALAGDQAFFHDFLGCQQLVHWTLEESSVHQALTHLWRAYQQAHQRVEEPRMDIVRLGNGWIEPGDEIKLQQALRSGLGFLCEMPRQSLAADRFLRILWRQFLVHYLSSLREMAHPECLAALLRVRDALADEIDDRLEFLVANLARQLKQWDQVEKSYLRGLALEPDNLEELLNLAEYYRSRNRFQEARALVAKAAKLNPGNQALVASLRSMSGQLALQHLVSPFLSDNPPEFQTARQELEALEPQALLSIAAMAHGLKLDDGGHLRAFCDVEERVFPNPTLCAMMTRELLQAGALLIYRYSPEQSYWIQGEWFDFDNDRVEWMLNLNWRGAPERALEDAALVLLRHRLAADPVQLGQLWRQVAVHELLYYAQQGFEQQGWYLEVTDYAYEVIGGLLESLSLWQARIILDAALEATKQDHETGNLPSLRQLSQVVIRHVQSCYERLLFNEEQLRAPEQDLFSESLWSFLFRERVAYLGRLFYEAVPGELALSYPD